MHLTKYFLILVILTSTSYAAKIGYGWSTATMNLDLLEIFYMGFELGLEKSAGPFLKAANINIVNVGDSTGSPLAPFKSANKLRGDEEIFVITGFPSSHDAIIAADVIRRDKDLTAIFIGAGHEDLAKKGDHTFTTGESMSNAAEVMLDFASRHTSNKRGLVICNPQAVFSQRQTDLIRQVHLRRKAHIGGAGQSLEFINLNSDFSLSPEVLAKVEQGRYGYILVTPYQDDSATLLDQLNRLHVQVPVLSSNWLPIEVLRRVISRRKAPIYVTVSWHAGRPESLEFEKLMIQKYKRKADPVSAYGYDAGVVIGTTLKRIKGPITRKSFFDAFKSNYCFQKTATGTLCFPPQGGHGQRKLEIMQYSLKEGFRPIHE